MRILIVAALALAASCSQPPAATPEAPPPPAVSADAASDALLAALTPAIAAEIGQPVRLEVTTVRVQDDWAWVSVQTLQPDGSPIDWTTTALASRFENGAMDESGGAYALLRNENGAWRLVTHVVAPTDVAWLAWPAEHGAPEALMQP